MACILNMRIITSFIMVAAVLPRVGCDGVLGSGRVLDACGVCGGGNSSCRIVSGIFTEPRLQAGYNTVAQLPAGACRIHIVELAPTKNYLALRDVRGEYIINGDWSIVNSGSYGAAGAVFVYRRQTAASEAGPQATPQHGDAITADGPTTEPVDIVLLYQELNRGIKYEYAIKHERSLQAVLPRLGAVSQPAGAGGGGGMQADGASPPATLPAGHPGALVSPLYQPGRAAAAGAVSVLRHHQAAGSHTNQLNDASAAPRPPDTALKHRLSSKRDPYARNADPYGNSLTAYGRNRDYHGNSRDPFRRLGPTLGASPTAQSAGVLGPSSSRRAVSKSGTLNRTRHRRRRRHRFHWLVRGLSECSATCGGGTQTARVLCVRRKRKQPVQDSKCDARRRPRVTPRPCNTQLCPAQWEASDWSPCSVTCGNGSQTATLLCVRQGRPVESAACQDREPPDPPVTRPCHLQPCAAEARWHVGEWGQCSVSCGWGWRTRDVTCTGGDAALCVEAERPRNTAPCQQGACPPPPPPPAADSGGTADAGWMVTEWSSHCSAQCGRGVQWRRVVCGAGAGRCRASERPAPTRACKTDRGCAGVWYTGPWSQCSQPCGAEDGDGAGVATRDVVCLSAHDDGHRAVGDAACTRHTRPETKRQCRPTDHQQHADCAAAHWFVGTWGACSVTCGPGSQSRTVACVEAGGRRSAACRTEEAPAARRHCTLAQCPRTASAAGGTTAPFTTIEESPPAAENAPLAADDSGREENTLQKLDATLLERSPDASPLPTVTKDAEEPLLVEDRSTLVAAVDQADDGFPSMNENDVQTMPGDGVSLMTPHGQRSDIPLEDMVVAERSGLDGAARDAGNLVNVPDETATAVDGDKEITPFGDGSETEERSALATNEIDAVNSELDFATNRHAVRPTKNRGTSSIQLSDNAVVQNTESDTPEVSFIGHGIAPKDDGASSSREHSRKTLLYLTTTQKSRSTTERYRSTTGAYRSTSGYSRRDQERASDTSADGELQGTSGADSCIDKFQYCAAVQQARLCKYKYYKNSCCATCRRS